MNTEETAATAMKTEIIYHNPDNLPTAGDPPWRFLTRPEKIEPGDQYWSRIQARWVNICYNPDGALATGDQTYRTRRPLPAPQPGAVCPKCGLPERWAGEHNFEGDFKCDAYLHITQGAGIGEMVPQPGGGGEAEEKWVPHVREEGSREHVLSYDRHGEHCSEPWCEINRQFGLPVIKPNPTPPIALPVRAEAMDSETLSLLCKSLTILAKHRGENGDKTVEEEILFAVNQIAALSRELEEGREGRADFIKLLASTLGVETDRQDYIVMHIQSLRAELEEAKAEVRIQKEAYETAAADRKFTAELSEQQAEQINGLQQQLTALRAAPRSETEGRDKERLALLPDVILAMEQLDKWADWIRDVSREMDSEPGQQSIFESEVAMVKRTYKNLSAALAHDEKGAGE